MDLYNIFGTAHDVEELTDVVSAIPGQQLVDALGRSGTSSMGLGLKLKTLVQTFGHWSTLYELYKVNGLAKDLKAVYEDYPSAPDGFDAWQSRRDALLEDVYAVTGAEPKY
jgi:electron-transferring-flavoprotein dehydrogenase